MTLPYTKTFNRVSWLAQLQEHSTLFIWGTEFNLSLMLCVELTLNKTKQEVKNQPKIQTQTLKNPQKIKKKKRQLGIVLLCQGCQNKVPQTWLLIKKVIYCLTSSGSYKSEIKMLTGMIPSEGCRKNPFYASSLVLGD